MRALVTTVSLVALVLFVTAALDLSGAQAGGKKPAPRAPDSVAGLDPDQDDAADDAGGSIQPRRPCREDAEDEFRRHAPQIEFVCQPASFGYDENDLLLRCASPLELGDELVEVFTVRVNNRFSSPAASLISAALTAAQPLLLTVNEPPNPHSRCNTRCRRINRAELSAAPPA